MERHIGWCVIAGGASGAKRVIFGFFAIQARSLVLKTKLLWMVYAGKKHLASVRRK